MKEYHIGQTVVPYEIRWSPDRDTIGLSIDNEMELLVRAPTDATLDEIDEVLAEKSQWVLETLYGIAEQQDPPLDKEFLSGEKLLYDGRRYRLKTEEKSTAEPELHFTGHTFNLYIPESDSISVRRKRQTVVDWYFNQAEEVLPDRAERLIREIGATDVGVEVSDLNRRWGEFENNTILLHWRLILAPRKIQDYVIAHELAHLRHGDHSEAFWNTVGTLVPDYRDRREWLRVNGASLRV